jgi:hypothetical protein
MDLIEARLQRFHIEGLLEKAIAFPFEPAPQLGGALEQVVRLRRQRPQAVVGLGGVVDRAPAPLQHRGRAALLVEKRLGRFGNAREEPLAMLQPLALAAEGRLLVFLQRGPAQLTGVLAQPLLVFPVGLPAGARLRQRAAGFDQARPLRLERLPRRLRARPSVEEVGRPAMRLRRRSGSRTRTASRRWSHT